jgi:membrane fusion protein (multidrug efflux system)
MHFSAPRKCHHHLFLLPVIALLASCGSGNDQQKQDAKKPPAIEGLILQPQHIEDNFIVSGNLVPMDEAVLMPETSGRIVSLNLPEGMRVSKGTLLVKLFDGDLQAQLQKLQAELKNAKTIRDRQESLLKLNGISQNDYDQTVTQVATLEADIAAVNAQISKTEIRAPFDGTIGLKKVSEGAFVSPGTPIATIRADQQFKLDFSVPEVYAALLSKGIPVTFVIDGDTTVFHAEVIATEQGIDGSDMNLHARALVKEKSSRLLPGGSANVNIGLSVSDNALVVPSEAIIPQARFKNVIVCHGGKAEYAKVKTGIRRPADVQILSGLKAGDTVVVTGIQFIRPGTPLRFTSIRGGK